MAQVLIYGSSVWFQYIWCEQNPDFFRYILEHNKYKIFHFGRKKMVNLEKENNKRTLVIFGVEIVHKMTLAFVPFQNSIT